MVELISRHPRFGSRQMTLRYCFILAAADHLAAWQALVAEAHTIPSWPGDERWFFAMHTDAVAAYVGGPAGLIADLLIDDRLETTPVRADDPFDDWTAR